MLWEVDIHSRPGHPDLLAKRIAQDAHDLGLAEALQVHAARGYLIQTEAPRASLERIAHELLADRVVERTVVAQVLPGGTPLRNEGRGEQRDDNTSPENHALRSSGTCHQSDLLVHVLPKPGVMDPVAQSAAAAIVDLGVEVEAVRTLKKYWIGNLDAENLPRLTAKVLANDAIEQVVVGPLDFDRIEVGSPYVFQLKTVAIRQRDDAALQRMSFNDQLYLSLAEMRTIRDHFVRLDRDPTDAELETLAQTWSEHCSHKTLAGRIDYEDEHGQRHFENMLRETIFAATDKLRREAGDDDWCVSVFEDNAGIVRFDDRYNVVFKVETHNHPSALEPYGGANTGLGGVIRDPMGTGMGARPVCNTDVFCFAPPDTPPESVPVGVLHPRRVIHGVVEGVRDYGNRMGIPTVNGAVYFDPRYLGNPLVYCGNVGMIPRNLSHKQPRAGDLIVALGGRTGRDGIHGATFSSAELHHESDSLSGGAVQIGNAVTEKMLLDVLLVARDRGLYSAVTDCGAGGFSSAVGEMGEKIGAEVDLDQIPLKYEGLSYTEMWISEAQERMVLSVPEEHWEALSVLSASEGVEATVIGRFVATGQLVLKYQGHRVAELDMTFLHDGRPPVIRQAVYRPPPVTPLALLENVLSDYTNDVHRILGSLNVASKHWIIRQYDHEVQGGSVLKPLVGVANDGPGDAAVVRPILDSDRGLVIACGMNPCYGDLDPYWMAASAIDEAIRNCVAVGADPRRIAILDNFCWGNTERPETLGSLVRAAIACYDIATQMGTPFISGKDSLNNEFRPADANEPISIPPSLLISALGQIDNVDRCVSMDLKRPGNLLYVLGTTRDEMGGSHYARIHDLEGGTVPRVDTDVASSTYAALHQAIHAGHVRACHDLSEGGLAVAAVEMAFAGGLGIDIDLTDTPCALDNPSDEILLFAESNSRFLCEILPDQAEAFEALLSPEVAFAPIGHVTDDSTASIHRGASVLVSASITRLKQSWQSPLDW